MNRYNWLGLIFILVLLHRFRGISSHVSRQTCGLYGQQPCSFVPSPAGVTPICATPGKTYCEQVPEYPIHIVRRLIDKIGIENANDLIVDESIEEFDSTRSNHIPQGQPNFVNQQPPPSAPALPPPPPPPVPYDPNSYGYSYPKPNEVLPQQQQQHPIELKPATDFYGRTMSHIATAIVHTNDAVVQYATPGLSYTFNQRQAPVSANGEYYYYRPSDGHSQNLYQHYSYDKPGYYRSNNYHTEYNPSRWFKRFVRDLSKRKLDESHVGGNASMHASISKEQDDGKSNYRPKRQSPGRMELCQTNFQYITPQAALNSQGNWMYVVNQVDSARQLVRTETCASSVCSNLCSLPNGYGSRCEQKYVQKRLIAVNGEGNNLYTDTFWFPSCCACTLAQL